MIASFSRRGFLRGLASLPLIGGGVALIGQPTAAAVAVTDALHERYLGWLAHEHRAAVWEHAYRSALAAYAGGGPGGLLRSEARAREEAARASYLAWAPDVPDVQALVAAGPPSSRAAVILSAAGVPLVGGLAR